MPSSTVPLQKNHHPSALCTSPDSRGLNLTVIVKKSMQDLHWLKFCSTESISNLLTLTELPQKVFFPLRYSQLASRSILRRLEKLCFSLWPHLTSTFLMFMWGISFWDFKCLWFFPPSSLASAEPWLAYVCLIVWKLLLKIALCCCLTICMMAC